MRYVIWGLNLLLVIAIFNLIRSGLAEPEEASAFQEESTAPIVNLFQPSQPASSNQGGWTPTTDRLVSSDQEGWSLDIIRYCLENGYADGGITAESDLWGWFCVSAASENYATNLDEVCRQQYGEEYEARYFDQNSAYSWMCVLPAESVPPPPEPSTVMYRITYFEDEYDEIKQIEVNTLHKFIINNKYTSLTLDQNIQCASGDGELWGDWFALQGIVRMQNLDVYTLSEAQQFPQEHAVGGEMYFEWPGSVAWEDQKLSRFILTFVDNTKESCLFWSTHTTVFGNENKDTPEIDWENYVITGMGRIKEIEFLYDTTGFARANPARWPRD